MPEESGPEPDSASGPGASRAFAAAAAALVILAAAAALPGIGTRALWGSERRWAEISREMLLSGDFFSPTTNGQVYFDKPLLSYWTILPFAWAGGGASELSARMPSALAMIALVLVTFAVGRRLFGERAGLLAGTLLATSGLMLYRARVAEADMLNALAVWVAVWAFVTGGREGRTGRLVLLHVTAAVGSFLKGPVAAAVIYAALGFESVVSGLCELRRRGWSRETAREALRNEFRWLISARALIGILAGAAAFAALLLAPVAATGSWASVDLMWKENVTRFLKPFDHVEPFYAYLQHAPEFFAPWSILLLAALWDSRRWASTAQGRTVLLIAAGIFIFFTASGSRRSYYIMPLIPALAVITGKALDDWIRPAPAGGGGRAMRLAALATGAVLVLLGAAIAYVAWAGDVLPRIPWAFVAAAAGVIGGAAAIALTSASRRTAAVLAMVAAALVIEVWYFTALTGAVERTRTMKPFCLEAASRLEGVPDERIALYGMGNLDLVFYLKRGALRPLRSPGDLEAFMADHPDGYVFVEYRSRREGTPAPPAEARLVPVIIQRAELSSSLSGGESDRSRPLALMRFGEPPGSRDGREDIAPQRP